MDIMYCTSSFSEVKSPIEAPLRRANRFLTIASAFALERTWVYQFQNSSPRRFGKDPIPGVQFYTKGERD